MDAITVDVVIVGAGGAGLRAAIAVAEADPDLSVALISKVYPMRLEPSERARLVLAHQPAVADDIRTQDGGKPAFNALPCHACLSRSLLSLMLV